MVEISLSQCIHHNKDRVIFFSTLIWHGKENPGSTTWAHSLICLSQASPCYSLKITFGRQFHSTILLPILRDHLEYIIAI